MILKFKSITLHNFMSFEDSYVDLDSSGYCLVSGKNNNTSDLAISNGSGKSSIWESILWTLTGDTMRGCKNVTRLGSSDGCYVAVKFELDNNEYEIIRSKDSSIYKTNLKIFINGEDKSAKGIRDSEKLLKEYLPDLTASLIGSVIILGQGLPQRFTNNSPSGRKEVLEKLSKSDFMIQDLKNRIGERKSKLSIDLREFEDQKLKYESENNIYDNQLSSLNNELAQINSINIDDIDVEIDNINSEIFNINKSIAEHNTDISKLFSELQEYLVEAQSLNSKMIFDIQQATDSISNNIKELTDEINSNIVEINSLSKEARRLDNISDTCPTCGLKLIGVEKPDTTEIHNKINNLKSLNEDKNIELNSLQVLLNNTKDSIKDKFTLELKNLNTRLQSKNNEISLLRNELQELQKNLNINSNNLLSKLNSKNLVLTKKSTISEQIESTKTKIDNNKLYIINVNNNINSVKDHINIVTKFDTLVKRDFRGYLLKNVIDFINDRAKYYCNDIFDTDKIDFTLDGNNISITYLDKEYESLSGGEKQKIDLIIQFSIRDMLCSFLNFSSNILVLDEITDNLDSIGCSRVINLISAKLKDVSNIYIISHRKDLDIPYDREIVVEKNMNGISKILENAV